MFQWQSQSFLQILADRYGNPKVIWATGKLRPGQRVRIAIKDEQYGDRLVLAKATGQQKKGKNIIRYRDLNSRTWMLPMDNENIQIKW